MNIAQPRDKSKYTTIDHHAQESYRMLTSYFEGRYEHRPLILILCLPPETRHDQLQGILRTPKKQSVYQV